MKNYFSNKNFSILLFFVASLTLILPIIFGQGVIFKYDWAWPSYNMGQFWNGLMGDNSFGLFSTLSKTGPAIFGLFGAIHISPALFLKLFILSVHFVAGYGFYRFIKSRVKSEAVAIISGLAYAFTPYIFIRTIIGFTWSLAAYAVLPIFLSRFFQPGKRISDYILIGFLFSLIFCQTQAGILTALIVTVSLLLALFAAGRKAAIKNYLYTFISLPAFALPWLVIMLFQERSSQIVSGGSVTTLNYIADLPHSFRNFFMLSDHIVTNSFFTSLSHNKLYLLGWLIVWLVALCAIFSKKNRQLVWTFLISCAVVLPFIKGPTGLLGNFYIWFYNHFPQIAVFRETYHFEFLYAISLCVLFAIGLDWVWQKIDGLKSKIQDSRFYILIKAGLKALIAGSAIFIIAPYLTFNYAGYLKLQKIPSEYYQLNTYFQQNKDVCQKIYYPPGFDFIYFKGDISPDASNSDTIAWSIGIPYLNGGTSVLNTASEGMFVQNEIISHFYEKNDNGDFAQLLANAGVDCVVVRQDLDTKYWQASNMVKEKDQGSLSKWKQNDWSSMIKTKKDLDLVKQFGENVQIYKINSSVKSSTERNYESTGKPAAQQFSQIPDSRFQILPLSDWANNYAYFRDGWSRGRYDFWRKLIFTQLRQDFVYTDKPDSTLNGEIAEGGNFEIWARYLTGGESGNYQLSIANYQFHATKDPGVEKFIWKKLGDIELSGQTNIEIKNIGGENAIADVVLMTK